MNTEEEVYCLRWRTHSVQHPVSTTGHRQTSKEEEKQGKYTISSLPHSHSYQLLSALGISWAWGGVHSLTLNTVLFQILGPSSLHPRETCCTRYAIQKGTEQRTISSCLFRLGLLLLQIWWFVLTKSDGIHVYKLLRMWWASWILPLWWELQTQLSLSRDTKSDSWASLLLFF